MTTMRLIWNTTVCSQHVRRAIAFSNNMYGRSSAYDANSRTIANIDAGSFQIDSRVAAGVIHLYLAEPLFCKTSE